MEHSVALQTVSLAVFLGILAQIISHKLKLPSLILLMLFGIVAGPNILHLLHTDKFTEITTQAISIGVAVILFEGGMTLNLKDLKLAPRATFNIITFGPFITLIAIGSSLHNILSLNWQISFLIGSILVISAPNIVASLLEGSQINKKLKEILTWESIIVESVGGVLMVVVLQFILSEADSFTSTAGHFLLRLAVGIGIGYITGRILLFLIPRKIIRHEHLNLAILGILLLFFWLSNHIASEAGLLTAVVAGIMVGQLRHPALEEIKAFKVQLSTLIVSVIFILISAQLDLAGFTKYGWSMALAILSVLIFARPLMIFLTTVKTGLSLREKLFLVWAAPRGVIAAATASLFTAILLEHHFPQAESVATIVFLVIITTVIMQGFTAGPIANLLKVNSPPRNGFLLVGINPFSISIAKLFQKENIPVKLIANKKKYISEAKESGLDVSSGNIMYEDELVAIGLERIGTMLALTDNDETNTLVCRVGRKLFGLDNAFQVVNTYFSDITDDVLLNFGGLLAFDMKMSVATINERLLSGRLKVEKLILKQENKGFKLPENFLSALFYLENEKATVAQEDDKIKTPTIIALTLS